MPESQVQVPTSSEPTKQPALGKNKRSRTGCLGCLHSKVKCDETSPICKRCTRTKKQCVWPDPRPALRDRRRGHGPYKDRTTKILQPLVPLVPASQSPEVTTEDTANKVIATNTIIAPRRKSLDAGRITTSPYAELPEIANLIDGSVNHQFESCDSHNAWDEQEWGALVLADEGESSNPSIDYWVQQQSNHAVAATIPYSLQATHMPSSSSVTLGQAEWEALQFFERVFATVYSPKTFSWSFLAIMGEFGKDDAAIQHLIIAVCLGQLDQQQSANDSFMRLGKSHYQTGAQLVLQEMHHAQHDHCKVFTTFWLIQAAYNTYWSDKAAASLAKLSQTMAQYTCRHRLLELFSKKGATSRSQQTAFVPKKNRGLLARLIIFCLYEDIDADFCHAGGSFAAELCADYTAIRGLYFAGRNVIAQYFESSYPQHELLDDIQRSPLLDLHFEANLALHRINQASKGNPSSHRFEKIASQLEELKMQYDAVFELTQIKNHENRKVGSSANNIVAHFLAVETYNLQCLQARVEDLSYTTELHSTIQSLLRTIGFLCKEWPMNMPYRNQWLFFIAGMGTSDPIHIAWIIDKLKQGRYYQTLRKLIEIQGSSEVQMSIDDVRSLFWGLGNDILPAERETTLVHLSHQRPLQDTESYL